MNTWNPDHCIYLNKFLKLPRRWYKYETGLCNLHLAGQENTTVQKKVKIVERILGAHSEIKLSQIPLLLALKPNGHDLSQIARFQSNPYEFAKALGLSEESLQQFIWNSQLYTIHNLENNQDYLNVLATPVFLRMLNPDFMKFKQTRSKSRNDSSFDDFWALKNPLIQWHDPNIPLDIPFDYDSLDLAFQKGYTPNSEQLKSILSCFRNDPTKLGAVVREWLLRSKEVELATPFAKESYTDIQGKSFQEIIESYPVNNDLPLSTIRFALSYLPYYSTEQWNDAKVWIQNNIEHHECLYLNVPTELAYVAPKERLDFVLAQPCFAHAIAKVIAETFDLFGAEIQGQHKTPIWRWRLDPRGQQTPLELANLVLKNANANLSMSDILARHATVLSLDPSWPIKKTYQLLNITTKPQTHAKNLDFMAASESSQT